jgi:hypothetical protein
MAAAGDDKRARQRANICLEVLASEQTYVRYLTALVEVFVEPLGAATAPSRRHSAAGEVTSPGGVRSTAGVKTVSGSAEPDGAGIAPSRSGSSSVSASIAPLSSVEEEPRIRVLGPRGSPQAQPVDAAEAGDRQNQDTSGKVTGGVPTSVVTTGAAVRVAAASSHPSAAAVVALQPSSSAAAAVPVASGGDPVVLPPSPRSGVPALRRRNALRRLSDSDTGGEAAAASHNPGAGAEANGGGEGGDTVGGIASGTSVSARGTGSEARRPSRGAASKLLRLFSKESGKTSRSRSGSRGPGPRNVGGPSGPGLPRHSTENGDDGGSHDGGGGGAGKGSALLDRAEHERVFGGVAALLPLHRMLLSEIEPAVARARAAGASMPSASASGPGAVAPPQPGAATAPSGSAVDGDAVCIGALFVRFAPFFHLYHSLMSGYAAAAETWAALVARRPALAAFVASAEADPRCGGQGMASLMIMPVQRLPRYGLLLREVLK